MDRLRWVAMTETQTFDLTEASNRYVADRRGPRIALLIAILVLAAGILGVSIKVALQLESGYKLSSNQVYLFVFFDVSQGLLALYVAWLRTGTAPGATRIDLSEKGIELYGPGMRVDRHLWSDPRTAFELQNFSSQSSVAETKLAYFLVLKRGRTSALTKEAYDAILAASEARGLVLPNFPNRVGTLFASGPSPMFYRVRGGPPQNRV